MLRFQIRQDRNFSNAASDHQWFRTGVIYSGMYPPMKTRTVRVFRLMDTDSRLMCQSV